MACSLRGGSVDDNKPQADRSQPAQDGDRTEAILRAVFECLPFDFFALGPDGRYFMQNAASKQDWGDAVGKTPEEICPNPANLAVWLDNNRRCFAGETVDGEVAIELHRGKRFYHNVLTPIRGAKETYGILGVNVDITDRKRVEEELRESRRRLATLLSNLPGMAYRCCNDDKWTMELVSDGSLALTGYLPEDLIGNRTVSYVDCILPADRPRVREVVERGLVEGRHFQIEYRIRTRSGETRWVWEQGVAVEFCDGRPVTLEGFITDVTKRKQAEESLRAANVELERRVAERTAALQAANEQLQREVDQRRRTERELEIFKRFAEASGQGFGIADLRGVIEYVNPAMWQMAGEESAAAMVGRHFRDYSPLDAHRQADEEVVPAVLQQGQWVGERPLLTRQGTVLPTLSNAFLLRDDAGRPLRLAMVLADLSERKRAEAELAESEAKYRQLIETTGTGYVILDEECCVLDANPEFVRLTGRQTLDEIRGHNVLEWTTPRDRDRAIVEIQKCLSRLHARQVEIGHLQPDGTILPVDINATCIDTREGRRIVGLCRDITERHQARQALERERQTLWHMLQASDHERQVIAYEIHDGLTQLLTGAMMQYQAYEHLKDGQPDKAAMAYAMGGEMLQMAHAEARRLISGVRPPVLDEAGLETAIAHLVHDRRAAREPKVEYQSDVEFDRLPRILENALYRIAQEALANACKHSGTQRVAVQLTQNAATIRLQVEDWGDGFDPATVPEGHFGLEGIRERVRLLGGQLQIDSAPGRGTRLRVEVPLLEQE